MVSSKKFDPELSDLEKFVQMDDWIENNKQWALEVVCSYIERQAGWPSVYIDPPSDSILDK